MLTRPLPTPSIPTREAAPHAPAQGGGIVLLTALQGSRRLSLQRPARPFGGSSDDAASGSLVHLTTLAAAVATAPHRPIGRCSCAWQAGLREPDYPSPRRCPSPAVPDPRRGQAPAPAATCCTFGRSVPQLGPLATDPLDRFAPSAGRLVASLPALGGVVGLVTSPDAADNASRQRREQEKMTGVPDARP